VYLLDFIRDFRRYIIRRKVIVILVYVVVITLHDGTSEPEPEPQSAANGKPSYLIPPGGPLGLSGSRG